MIEHLKRLGVTAIELLPIHAFVDDRHLVEHGLSNYWGYNTLGFFAPEPRYRRRDDALDAFRSTVARLHDAGIEVILDVVYNHTAEGNQLGPTLCFRGIDNASYYWLKPDEPRYYENFTGTGNSLNLTHPRVLQMVMDSLRYWVEVVPCRRLPLRSRDHAGARAQRLRSAMRRSSPRSGRIRCWPRQADRRAVGHRPRRLSGRRLSARLVGMERHVPAYAAPLLGAARAT